MTKTQNFPVAINFFAVIVSYKLYYLIFLISGNIDKTATAGDVASFFGFERSDRKCFVELMMDLETGQCSGYGFITVPAQRAHTVSSFNGM